MQIPFYTSAIIACVPFLITGRSKSGKSTLIQAALSLLPAQLKTNHYTLTSKSDFGLIMNRMLQRLQMKGNGNYYSPYTTC